MIILGIIVAAVTVLVSVVIAVGVILEVQSRQTAAIQSLYPVAASLIHLMDTVSVKLQPEARASDTDATPTIPPSILALVGAESEPWAVEDLTGRARELFNAYHDGRNADATWAKVLHHMELESRQEG